MLVAEGRGQPHNDGCLKARRVHEKLAQMAVIGRLKLVLDYDRTSRGVLSYDIQ